MFFSLILENAAGDQINMTATANQYMTSKIEGLSPPPGTISTSSYAGMDGSYLNNAFIEKRNVVISFEMRGIGVEKRRHQLYKVVKPSRFIKVYYKTAGIDVFTEGYVETCEVSNFEQLVTGQISILCPDIYWYSTESVMAYYSQITGAFTFPFPTESNPEPFVLGKFNTQNIMEIINDGDEIGFTLQIEALADVRSPTLYNADTDEYLQITGDILAGDIITVTTKTGHKTVTLDRGGVKTNIINRLVSGSTWMTLREGKNRFYLRGTGLQNLKVTIVHTNAYLGVRYMQIEVYRMDAEADNLTITLEAVCDSFSSLLWDIEYYQCGSFEVYIAANPENLSIFQTGRIVGRDDDSQHFGIIESVQIDTDAENGDYLTVRGRFLMCLLERRIIHPTYNVTAQKAYSEIVHDIVRQNALLNDNRRIPGLSLGAVSGACWEQTTTLQVSYENLMEWVYTICEKIGGTANIRLMKDIGETYKMVLDLTEGTDRSLLQEDNPHIIFSDAYSNLLSFSYASDTAITRNFAYIYGHGEGAERKNTTYCVDSEPAYLERYELYVDAKDISEEEQVEGETVPIPEEQYIALLKTRGSEKLVDPKTASESEIAANSTQYAYNRDYFVGDYVTVEHKRFGMIQPKVQLIGMIEAFDQNGRSLTPTFKE